MPRYDDRSGGSRLYVGHLSSRTRTRDLEDMFNRYGRIRGVDMKRDYAFVEFSDPRDADDARYSLNGRDIDGSRIVVEFAKGVPRGAGGSREIAGRGPPPGSGRCFNCGIDGHWARDCKAGDWKNKCYRCGERGHTERNCKGSPKKLRRGRSYSRSPSPRRGRSRSRSYSRGRSDSRSRSPVRKEQSVERRSRSLEKRSRSPRDSRSPKKHEKRSRSPRDSRSPKRHEKRSRSARDSRSPKRHRSSLSPSPPPRNGRSPSPPINRKRHNASDYSGSPRAKSRSPFSDADVPENKAHTRNSADENGKSRSPSPIIKDDRSPIED